MLHPWTEGLIIVQDGEDGIDNEGTMMHMEGDATAT